MRQWRAPCFKQRARVEPGLNNDLDHHVRPAGQLAADPGLLGDQTLLAVRASDGDALAVEEAEIVEAVRLLGQEGLMIEPSGAVTVAAVRRGVRDGLIDRAESVVCVLTGSGFKDFDRILDLVEIPRDVVSGYEAMLAEAERI
jgi:threonine synthase